MNQTSRIQDLNEIEKDLDDLITALYLLEREVNNLPHTEQFKKLIEANEEVQGGVTAILVKYMDFISNQIGHIHEKIGRIPKVCGENTTKIYYKTQEDET